MDDIELKTSQSSFDISEWFKELDWIGIGIGILGVTILAYYLIKKDKE